MNKTIFGALLILAGLAVPLVKGDLGTVDKGVMLLFLACGALLLLSGKLKKQEADEYYRYNLELEDIRLFDSKGRAALSLGQQLYVQAYQGADKNEVHLKTAEGDFVAVLPPELRDAALHKIEKHSPVLVHIRGLKPQGVDYYSISIELMC